MRHISKHELKYSLLRTLLFVLLIPGFVLTIPGSVSSVNKGSQTLSKAMIVHAFLFFLVDMLSTLYL
jgi:hypothetical protein